MKVNRFKIVLLLSLISLFFLSAFITTKISKNKPVSNVFSQKELLGKSLFFDVNYSNPKGISCASCHSQATAFSDPANNVFSPGVYGKIGNRNSPSIMYVTYTPNLVYTTETQDAEGGFFMDGRAKTLQEQLVGPFFNTNEMNAPNKQFIASALQKSSYFLLYQQIYGTDKLSDSCAIMNNIVDALSAFLGTKTFNAFTSKYDYYLQGLINLTPQEQLGLKLFNDEKKGNCAACHPSTPKTLGEKVLFTDYTYDNIGLPAHSNFTHQSDLGLGAVNKRVADNGKFKVPTLRNIALTQPYFHNGVINTLEEVIDFYNNRNTAKFGKPDVADNINNDELGNLNLTDTEQDAIVAFLKTLTDGYAINNPSVLAR